MFSCKCLNILIHGKNSDISQNIDFNQLQLTEEEKNDKFFNKEVFGVIAESITKQQSGLVLPRQVGLWVVHMCLNCSLETHAVHRDKGASCVLVAGNLLSGASNIAVLRNTEHFSSAFGILINPFAVNEVIDPKITVSQLPESLQVAVSGLQQQLADVLKREVAATEERVRRYSETQYANLENFRDQVHKEHNALLRLVLNTELTDINTNKLENPTPKPPINSYQSKAVTETDVKCANNVEAPHSSPRHAINKPKHPLVTNIASKTKRPFPRQLSQPVGKTDSEDGILFQMDGMEESPTLTHSDVEESDTDDSASHDEGIHIPRQRTQSMSIAKSLPMNIPVFMSAFPHEIIDDRDDLKVKEDFVDIAASIKALAKSVHGDDVFGDLPRPRFSTQI